MIYSLSLDLFTFHGISSHSTSNAKLLFLFFFKVNSAKLKMFLRLLCWNVLVLLKVSGNLFRKQEHFWCYFVRTRIWVWIYTQILDTIMRYHALSCAAGGTRSLDAKWLFIDREFPNTSSPKMRIELNPFMTEVVII